MIIPPRDPQGANPAQVLSSLREIIQAVRAILSGTLNSGGVVTLDAGGTTTLRHPQLGAGSMVLLDPITASAAGALASGSLFCPQSGRTPGAWIYQHANGANDRTFRFVIFNAS